MTKEEFLKDVNAGCSHRELLWLALEKTKGSVVELGSGFGSTEYLRKYCKENNREFVSVDNNTEWCEKTGAIYISNWDDFEILDADVLLIDHAPGERRHIDIARFANVAKVIIIHDSEPEATGYMLDKIWHLFPYKIDHKFDNAMTSLVSNHFNKETWEK